MVKKANLKKSVKKIIDFYLKTISKEIKINGVLLFGSYAYGRPTKHSDVDLVIISPDFKKKNFDQRLDWLSEMRKEPTYKIAMDIIGYTPQEFNNIEKFSAIMAKAKKDGFWLYRRH